jgi:hypothetical protein
MTVSRTYQLSLSDSQEKQFDDILNKIQRQFERLSEHNIRVSDLTKELMILTIMGIVAEPNKKWPPFSDAEKELMQTGFVDALALNFLNMSYNVETRERNQNIQIFDAIEVTAQNSWFECCIVTAVVKD